MKVVYSTNPLTIEVGDLVKIHDSNNTCLVIFDESTGKYPFRLVNIETCRKIIGYTDLRALSKDVTLICKASDLALKVGDNE